MAELEEVGERSSAHAARAQSLVYTLPHTTESIAEFLTPILSRVDPSVGGTQVVVVTRDAETALAISETILRLSGPAAIEVVPITSAGRAGRIFRSRPVLAVAGTAVELGALVRASLLKADVVRTVALAWIDDILDDGSLDQTEEMLDRLDVRVASVHSKLAMDKDAMTRRMTTAVANPFTNVLEVPKQGPAAVGLVIGGK